MAANAWLSKELEDKKVLCLACAHVCKLNPNEFGKCGVRVNEDGKLKLSVYGLAAAVNIDPVEKKPMFHFLPGSSTFSIGTVGCNFSCKFCQNWEISQYPQTNNHKIFGQKLLPKEIVDLALKYRCKSISYTYNEPIVYFEYTYDTAKIAKEAGLKNIYVTSGYETTKAIDYLSGVIDGFNIDLKSFSDNFYKKICNASLKPVLKAIEYSYKKGIFIEITTLLIPDENDSEEEIRKIARFIASIDTSIPWHISRFYPTYKMSNKNLTSLKTLLRAYEIGKEEGLKYVYIGNLNAPEYETTYCPNCNFSVIKRSGHLGERVENHLKNGKCPKCSTNIFGVWE